MASSGSASGASQTAAVQSASTLLAQAVAKLNQTLFATSNATLVEELLELLEKTTQDASAIVSGNVSSSSSASASNDSRRFPFNPPQRWHSSESGPPHGAGSGLSTAAIIGIVAAVLGAVGVIVAFFLWYKRLERNLRAQQELEEGGEGATSPSSSHTASEFVHVRLDSSRHVKKLEPIDRKLDQSDNSSSSTASGSKANRLLQPAPKPGIWDDPMILAMRLPADEVVEDLLLAKSARTGMEIYRGALKSGSVVAIKSFARANSSNKRPSLAEIEAFFEEARLVSSLNLSHARMVSLLGVCWDSLSNVRLVAEFVARGDLRTYLSTLPTSHSECRDEDGVVVGVGIDQQKTKIAIHVSQALMHLHALAPPVCYRDLTSRSVLLDDNLDAKLSVFSLISAQKQAHAQSSPSRPDNGSTVMIPSLWLAPEVMTGAKYDERADMYSFGILLSELDSNALPFANHSTKPQLPQMALLNLVALGKLTAEFSSPQTPPEIAELGKRCLSLDPGARPSAVEAVAALDSVLSNHA